MKIVTQNPASNSLDRVLRTQSEMRKRWLYILPAVFITQSLALPLPLHLLFLLSSPQSLP
jgi:hypothetical protein